MNSFLVLILGVSWVVSLIAGAAVRTLLGKPYTLRNNGFVYLTLLYGVLLLVFKVVSFILLILLLIWVIRMSGVLS